MVALSAHSLHAQGNSSDKAAARALFDEGRKLAAQGKHGDACPKFEESQRIEPGVGTMFHLADCQEATGKTASAWAMFLEVASKLKAEGGQADKEQAARQRAAALEPKLSRLKIVVPEGVAVPGLSVNRDGRETGKGSWGTAIPVDPGKHVIEASAPGKKTWTMTIEVGKDGANDLVTIPALQEGAGPVAAVSAEQPAPAKPADNKGARLHDGWYVRLAIGAGGATDKFQYKGLLASVDGKATGGMGVGEIGLGYAIKPGIILGGVLFVEQVSKPKVEVGGQAVSSNVSIGTFGLLGPMMDWYVDPKGGFHLIGALGLASLQMKDTTGAQRDNKPAGGGGVLGAGYELWVADEWSLGLQGRITVARMVDSSVNVNHTWTSLALGVTATYN
jgi:hypothetical protein